MPSNLRDYMNKNNITNSSRESREEMRPEFGNGSYVKAPYERNERQAPKKFMSSKTECSD